MGEARLTRRASETANGEIKRWRNQTIARHADARSNTLAPRVTCHTADGKKKRKRAALHASSRSCQVGADALSAQATEVCVQRKTISVKQQRLVQIQRRIHYMAAALQPIREGATQLVIRAREHEAPPARRASEAASRGSLGSRRKRGNETSYRCPTGQDSSPDGRLSQINKGRA